VVGGAQHGDDWTDTRVTFRVGEQLSQAASVGSESKEGIGRDRGTSYQTRFVQPVVKFSFGRWSMAARLRGTGAGAGAPDGRFGSEILAPVAMILASRHRPCSEMRFRAGMARSPREIHGCARARYEAPGLTPRHPIAPFIQQTLPRCSTVFFNCSLNFPVARLHDGRTARDWTPHICGIENIQKYRAVEKDGPGMELKMDRWFRVGPSGPL
jgi:hypothetical protein